MEDGLAFFDIIIFAMLAGYLAFQLRRVLGRRTDQEQRRSNPFSRKPKENPDNDNVVALPDLKADDAAESKDPDESEELHGLSKVRSLDPNFDEREFLKGSRSAFEWIVSAFASGNIANLSGGLLSEDLQEQFISSIETRQKNGEELEVTVVSIKSATIEGVVVENTTASVTVEFVSDQVKVYRDSSGEILEGDPDRIDTLTDIWTFKRDIRSNDPNWQLVKTSNPDDDS